MNIAATYDYLMRARRDLWAALEAAPAGVLERPMLDGERFHCINDLVFHIASVEDSWVHEDILREEPVRAAIPALKDVVWEPVFDRYALRTLLDYWRAVEQGTLAYLAGLTEAELQRAVMVDEATGERQTVDGLLWHVMIHEMRHTAQIAMLLRMQGIKPPALDLLWYLPGV